jgi:putative DNA primase/helicase
VAAENEQGMHWNETKVKTLTGGDRIAARFMRQDLFEFDPQFFLMAYGNNKPGIRTVDAAMKARIQLVPFTVFIPPEERDPKLKEKLKAEWSGILQWMIEGCLIWQSEGLVAPPCVEAATAEYIQEEDLIGRWIDECCVRDPQALTQHSVLFNSWKDWAERARAFIGPSKRLAAELKTRDFAFKETNQGLAFTGLRVANRFAELADAVFVGLLKKQKKPVSANQHEDNYAPKVFATQHGAADEDALRAAMQRLLRSGRIKAHKPLLTLTVAVEQ